MWFIAHNYTHKGACSHFLRQVGDMDIIRRIEWETTIQISNKKEELGKKQDGECRRSVEAD